MATPPKKYPKTLAQCTTPEERIALVRQAMEDGHSNTSAAKALGTTLGTIAGLRNKNKIPSKNSAPPMYPPTIPRQRLKVAVSEAKQCIEMIGTNGHKHRCGYEIAEGLDKCALHCDRRVKRAG